ncbi:hypothetical protein OG555_07375 [Kribbella sp. NBC_01484]|uniref:hypothetical protein n=1 Tax=Kribbella sp. NBC_01484 TaxID=2903579 RepID=UPI002E2EC2EE|nr:hypothetical protein [Kribbella sp. NBC_01484]
MFEGDLATLTTADLLASAADHDAEARRVDARRLEHAQVYADRFHPDACPARPGRRSWEGRERAVVLGGDGCPEILEFAVAEFAVILGISPRVAANCIGQALALRHRFPFTWARVQAGDATPWKACRIVADCAKLTQDAAAYVDQRIARLIDSITPYRLNKIVQAAKMHTDPDLARAEAAEQARERGVFVGRSTEHGTKTMYIKAAAGAVIRNKATLDAIADALKTFGDTRSVQHRRADAVGILADPRYTQELLTQARHHHLTTPAQDTPAQDTPAPDTTARETTARETTARETATRETAARETAARDTAGPDTTAPDAAGLVSTSRPGAGDRAAGPLRRGRRGAGCPEAGDDDRPHATTDDLARARVGHQVGSGHGVAAAGASGMPGAGSASRWGDQDRTGNRTVVQDEPGLDDEADRDAPHPSGSDLPDPLDSPDTVPTEPGLDDEADRDAPHPSTSDLPDPLDTPDTVPIEPFDPADPGLHLDPDDGQPMDAAARRALHARLAQMKQDAYTTHPTRTGEDRADSPDRTRGRVRPGQTQIYVHLTDHTLATGTGVLRAEAIGPLLADQLAELIGHGPYTVKPVIDLNDAVSVDAYEIPDRIRERVKLTHPVELFPFGTQETHPGMDLDHLRPYDPLGPPGQTNTTNLAPLGRYGHRVKTHAHGWTVHRLDHQTLEWTTPHGFTFHVDPTGTHRVPDVQPGES